MKKILAFLFTISLFYFVGAQGVLAASNHDVEIRTYLDSSNMNLLAPGLTEKARGSKIQFPPSGISSEYSFAYFAVNDIVRDDLPFTHEFVVRSNMKITAIYHPNGSVTPANARHVVVFADSKNQIIDVQYIVDGEDAIEPTAKLPVLPPFAKYAATKWLTSDNISDLTNIESNRVYFLQYEVDTVTNHIVTVTNGTGSGSYLYNTVVTATPNSAPGEQVFSHWADANGNVLSTKQNYKFTVLGSITIQAVFSATPNNLGAIVSMSDALNLRDGYVSYKGQIDLPAGYTLVEYGFIFSRSSDVLTVDSLGATIVPSNVHNGETGEFLRSFPEDTFNSVRAYVIVKNASNVEEIKYSENKLGNVSLQETVIFEAGFESGFSTSNVYNTLSETQYGPEGYTWALSYGAVTATGAINGQSAQMRWYTTAATKFGYLVSKFTFNNVTKVEFDAYAYAGIGLKVEYSLDGTNWLSPENYVLSTSTANYTYNVNQTGNVYLRFSLTIPGSNPTETSRLIIDNIKVYSMASIATHEVIYNYDSTSTTTNVADGNLINFVPTKTGHSFVGWYLESNFVTQYNLSIPINESLVLYGKFSPIQYSIIFSSNGGTGVTTITQDYGSLVLEPSEPTKAGYEFNGWYTDNGTFNDIYVFETMPLNGKTLYAEWIPIDYTITFDSNEGSVVAPIVQAFGSSVLEPENPTRNGFSFSGWYYDDELFSNAITFPVNMPLDGDIFYAKWISNSVVTYTVTYDIDINTSLEPSPEVIESGTSLSEPTSASASFKWYSDISRTTPFVFPTTVTSDITIYGKIFAKDLIISEYVEGSSNNKYIEIYNGTGATIDLSNYQLLLFTNGNESANNKITLSGTLGHGSVVVYKNSSAVLTLPLGVSATNNAAVGFNGDDAIVLRKTNLTVVDSIGKVGQDPGSSWLSEGIKTVDSTLVRKPDVLAGDITTNNDYLPNLEWNQFAIDTVSNLGSHTANVSNP